MGKKQKAPRYASTEVTCPECMPVAAKHRRGAILQAFEQTEVAWRAAKVEYDKRAAAFQEAAGALDRASKTMTDARAAVVAALPLAGAS